MALSRAARGVIEDSIARSVVYFLFASEFGWTPREVDETPKSVVSDLLVLLAETKRESERRLKREMK